MPTEFVLCEHPDLPGQTARLPRSALANSDWRPVDQNPPTKRRGTRMASQARPDTTEIEE